MAARITSTTTALVWRTATADVIGPLTTSLGPLFGFLTGDSRGITDIESHLIYEVEGDHNAPNREDGQKRVGEIAATFVSSRR